MKIHKWLSEFKLALIEEDSVKLEELLDTLNLKKIIENHPQKENLGEILPQIQALLKEAFTLLSAKKDAQALEIQKFQKAIKYIKA